MSRHGVAGRGMVAALGGALLGLLALAFVPLGAVYPGSRAVVHVALGAVLLLLALLPSDRLSYAGAASKVVVPLGLVVLALGVGLVPVPMAVLEVVAPGVAEARPGVAWWSLAHDPERVVSEIATWVLLAGFAAAVGAWGGVSLRVRRVLRGIVCLVLVLEVSAILHALLGAQSAFGVMVPREAPLRFYGPLVNANHLASVLVLAVPILVSTWATHRGSTLGIAAMVATALAGGLLLAIHSAGALLALGVVAGVVGWRRWSGARERLLLVVAGGVTGVAIIAGVVMVERVWLTNSLGRRFDQLVATLSLAADHWLTGVGGGGYVVAYAPYDPSGVFNRAWHVHNDWLEWCVETGVVGLLLGAVALALLLRWGPRRRRALSHALELGLIGVGVHALVEFPVQIPAVAMAVAGVWGLRVGLAANQSAGSARTHRTVLVGLAMLQGCAAIWEARTAVADGASSRLAARFDPVDEARLAWTAPWRPELGLTAAWRSQSEGDHEAAAARAMEIVARHPNDASTLRRAGLVLLRSGAWDDAESALARAAARGPVDHRTWQARSRLAMLRSDVPAAVSHMSEAIRVGPPDADAMRAAWELYPVVAHWESVLEDAPPSTAWVFAAVVRRGDRANDLEMALRASRVAVAREPRSFSDTPRLAELLRATGRLTESEAEYRTLLTSRPSDPVLLVGLGRVLEEQGRLVEAQALFLQASAVGASAAAVRALRVKESLDGPAEALRLAERISLSGASSPALQLECARLEALLGNGARCLEYVIPLLEVPEYQGRARRVREACGGAVSRDGP